MAQDYDMTAAAVRCPICSGAMEAYRVQRFHVVGGRWRAHERLAWTAHCTNGHEGTAETLPGAFQELSRRHRS